MKVLNLLLVMGSVVGNAGVVSADVIQRGTSVNQTQTLEHVEANTRPGTRLSIGPALGVIGDFLGAGADAGLLFNAGSRISVGLQTGIYRWAQSATASTVSASVSLISVPLLATALYRFDATPTIHPYFGISLGASFVQGSATLTYSAGSASGSAARIFFESLVRPGVEFALSPTVALYAEPKLGILKDQFVFLPHAGFLFSL